MSKNTKFSLLNNVFILITTRDGDFVENMTSYKNEHVILEPFEKKESFLFLKKKLGNKLKNENEFNELMS